MKYTFRKRGLIIDIDVQFPNSVPVIVNVNVTLNFVALIGRPQCNCNGRFLLAGELASPAAEF